MLVPAALLVVALVVIAGIYKLFKNHQVNYYVVIYPHLCTYVECINLQLQRNFYFENVLYYKVNLFLVKAVWSREYACMHKPACNSRIMYFSLSYSSFSLSNFNLKSGLRYILNNKNTKFE